MGETVVNKKPFCFVNFVSVFLLPSSNISEKGKVC